jgi:hypothetical protein
MKFFIYFAIVRFQIRIERTHFILVPICADQAKEKTTWWAGFSWLIPRLGWASLGARPAPGGAPPGLVSYFIVFID